MVKIILVMLASYLAGSIPFGLLITKLFKGVDVRNYGSGNTGATNVYRVLGLGGGLLALILDAGKGALAVKLAQSVLGSNPFLFLLAGLFAVAGHNVSIFLKFDGGRGVATSVGVLSSLAPVPMLVTFIVWLIIVIISQYVSLGSIVGAVILPVLMIFFNIDLAIVIFTVLMAAFVIYSHKPNIKRLLAGTENKVELKLTPDQED